MKTKILQYVTFSRILAFMALCFLIALSLTGFLKAQQFTRGYSADSSVERGMIVRLQDKNNSKVEPVKANDASRMYGIVVDPNDAPVTLSSEDQKVFVATSGRFEMLVSDQNGAIQAGDYLTISRVAGVGMKADGHSPYITGKAMTTFDGNSNVVGSAVVGNQEVALSRVLSDITVAANPLFKSSNPWLGFLEQSVASIAGKPVSAPRVYLAFFIAVASVLVAGNLLYSGVRGSMVAIGRNPLSKTSISRSMTQVSIVSLIIFAVGLGTVYLLLKL